MAEEEGGETAADRVRRGVAALKAAKAEYEAADREVESVRSRLHAAREAAMKAAALIGPDMVRVGDKVYAVVPRFYGDGLPHLDEMTVVDLGDEEVTP